MKSNVTEIIAAGFVFMVKSHSAGEVDGFPFEPEESKYRGPHYRHRIFVSRRIDNVHVKGVCRSFYFYGSTQDYLKRTRRLKTADLLDAFRCMVDDAVSGLMDFEEFWQAFDYDEDSYRARMTHRVCKNQLRKLRDLGLTEDDIYNVLNSLPD